MKLFSNYFVAFLEVSQKSVVLLKKDLDCFVGFRNNQVRLTQLSKRLSGEIKDCHNIFKCLIMCIRIRMKQTLKEEYQNIWKVYRINEILM